MSELLENAPGIIDAASKSHLGILALLILVVASLALLFFRNASHELRLSIFVAFFVGTAAFAYAVVATPKADMTFYVGNHGVGTKSKDLGQWEQCSEGPTVVRLNGGYNCEVSKSDDGSFILSTTIRDPRADVTCSAICSDKT